MADVSLMVIPPTMTAVQLFAPGKADEIIGEIKDKARAEAASLDISSKEGREAIAALAYKIARTKTATDKMRLELVADRKKELKLIDAEGARIWDELEALQKEVRQPLTEWENRDKERIAKHEAAIAGLETASNCIAQDWQTISISVMKAELQGIDDQYSSSHDWQEFGSRGALAVKTAKQKISEAITKRETYEAEQMELARLRAEAAERAQREREEAAAKAAKEEAERKAAEEARIAREAAEAEQRRLEHKRLEAEARAKQAEAQRIEAERQAELRRQQEEKDAAERLRLAEEKRVRDLKEAEDRAEKQRLAAVEAERQRAATEQQRQKEEAEARERNKKHAAKINGEAKAALLNHTNLTAENAEDVIKAIVKGLIPHVTISY